MKHDQHDMTRGTATLLAYALTAVLMFALFVFVVG